MRRPSMLPSSSSTLANRSRLPLRGVRSGLPRRQWWGGAGCGARFLECGLLHADDAALAAAVRPQSRDAILAEAVLVREPEDDKRMRRRRGRHGSRAVAGWAKSSGRSVAAKARGGRNGSGRPERTRGPAGGGRSSSAELPAVPRSRRPHIRSHARSPGDRRRGVEPDHCPIGSEASRGQRSGCAHAGPSVPAAL